MTWDFIQCGMCNLQSLRSACAYPLSDQSHCLSLEYSMTIKLLTEDYLEFLSLKGGCTGSSESKLVKMPHCWKSHVAAHMFGSRDPENSSQFSLSTLIGWCIYFRISVVLPIRQSTTTAAAATTTSWSGPPFQRR